MISRGVSHRFLMWGLSWLPSQAVHCGLTNPGRDNVKQASFNIYAAGVILGALALPGAAQAQTADTRDVVRDARGAIVVNSFGNCVRTKWDAGSDACGAAPVAKQKLRATIAAEERTVYFQFNKASLTTDAQAKLNTLASTLKSDDQVQQARIVGYADRIGQPAYNEALSKKRAESVRSYLISRGFINTRVAETRWLGESVPATSCPDNLLRSELIECLQKDRRVEVEIDYLPEAGTQAR